jgi:hypothetical protein
MMSVNMFSLFVLFVGAATQADNMHDDGSADKAAAAFSFFLFLLYGIFSWLLTKYRAAIITKPGNAGTASSAPAQAAGAPNVPPVSV